MRRILPKLAGGLAALVLGVGTTWAAELTVEVSGLRSGDGKVHVALFDRPETFPKKKELLVDAVVPAKPGGVRIVFRNLMPGTYAAATYHDENGNGAFDQGFLGVPLEGYAFSNGAMGFLSAPGFEDAAIPVDQSGAEIVIRLGY